MSIGVLMMPNPASEQMPHGCSTIVEVGGV
jgi:hypothetical protein